MKIEDMPHVTVEQVLELRKEAIKLEDRVFELRAENVELLNRLNNIVLTLISTVEHFENEDENVRCMDSNVLHYVNIQLSKEAGDL